MNDIISNYKKELVGIILITIGFILTVSSSLSGSPFFLIVSGLLMGVGLSLLTLNFIDFCRPQRSIPSKARFVVLQRDSTYELWVRISDNSFRRSYSHPDRDAVLERMERLIAAEHELSEFDTGPIFKYELFDGDLNYIGTASPEEW